MSNNKPSKKRANLFFIPLISLMLLFVGISINTGLIVQAQEKQINYLLNQLEQKEIKGSIVITIDGITVYQNNNLINRNAYFMIRCKVFNQSDSCTNLAMSFSSSQNSFARTLALGNSNLAPTSTQDTGCPGDLNPIIPRQNATVSIPSTNTIVLSTSWTSPSSLTIQNACVLQRNAGKVQKWNTFSWVQFNAIQITAGQTIGLSWTFTF